MREDYNIDNDDEVFDSSDDILNLLQNYNDDENKSIDSNEPFNDETDEDLLALLDMISAQEESMDKEHDILALDDNLEFQPKADEEDQKADDIMSLDDTWDSNEFESAESKKSHLSDIFSDVLSAVDTLEDKELDDLDTLIEEAKKQTEKPAKKNFFQKIFSKLIKSNKSEKDAEPKKKNVKKKAETAVPEEKSAEKKASAKKITEKKAVAKKSAEKKAVDKKVVEKKAKVKNVEEKNTKEKKSKTKKVKEKKPQLKKAKTKPPKKEKAKINDNQENQIEYEGTNISIKAYTSILIFCGLLISLLILSTNLYTYSLGIQNASINFERGRYSEAYYEIYGTKIRKKDEELYDKVMTVMHLNRQLEAYKTYYETERYPKALDALIKGMKRYDEYIDHAKELGIEEDMTLLRETILAELEDKFNISEKEAEKLSNIKDKTQYSVDIYTVVLEKMD